jgi:pyruvate kinase
VRVARRLALVWGTYGVQTPAAEHVTEIVAFAGRVATDQQLAGPGEIIAIAAGMPFGAAGTKTNLLRIERLPDGQAKAAGGLA